MEIVKANVLPQLKNLSFSTITLVRLFLAIAAGYLLNYAQAPADNAWLIFISFPILYALIVRAKSAKRAFISSFIFNCTYLAANSFWIANALTIDPQFIWFIPIVVTSIPAYMALFTSMCSLVLYYNRNTNIWSRILPYSLTWSFMEYIRSKLSYGFSMSAIGHVAAFSDNFAQIASILGVYGISFLIILLTSICAEAFMRTGKIQRYLLFLTPCLILSITYIWGNARLHKHPADSSYDYSIKLRIVQGGLSPYQLWRTEHMQNILLRKYLSLSLSEGYESITHFIWGESTMPMPVHTDKTNLHSLVHQLPINSFLLTGSIRTDMTNIFNSWIAVDNNTGQIKAHYDKKHLVPFGEYLPFRPLLIRLFREGGLGGIQDYTPGSAKTNAINIDRTPSFHVIICYETMFYGQTLRALNESIDNNRPIKWIINVTNDGWFGTSNGPYQHLAIAKIRAIESGLPFIRSTNNGISMVFDAYGRKLGSIPVGQDGVLDIHLPTAATRTAISVIYKYTRIWFAYFIAAVVLWMMRGKLNLK